MNKTKILDYNVFYDKNGMIDFCEKNNVQYYPFKKNKNMSGLISYHSLERGLVMKSIELRQMSY